LASSVEASRFNYSFLRHFVFYEKHNAALNMYTMTQFISSILLITVSFFVSSSSLAVAQTIDSLKVATIKVKNLHCKNDMPTIKKRLLNQEGIEEVSFTAIAGDVSTFTISYHSIATNQANIEKAIEATPGCDDPLARPYKVKKESNRKKKNNE
jgi:copper chaperone CopZ